MFSSTFGDIKPFNSHPHKEDDENPYMGNQYMQPFNSHPHKEDDSVEHVILLIFQPFNSHPHKEDDNLQVVSYRMPSLSTHILTRRMTTFHMPFYIRIVFQLTSSQGG